MFRVRVEQVNGKLEEGNREDLASTYVLHPLVLLAVCPVISGQLSETGVRRNSDRGQTEVRGGWSKRYEVREEVSSVIKPGPRLVLVKFNKILNSLAVFS